MKVVAYSTTWLAPYLEDPPVRKWLVTPIGKPFRPFGRGTTLLTGQQLTMVMNHLLTGMILQVGVSVELTEVTKPLDMS